MTPEEIQKLLAATKEKRQLLYETAMLTGLRAGELRALKVRHLDIHRQGLHLEAKWTKNRRKGFQPLPLVLLNRLVAASEGKNDDAPLLKVPVKQSQALDRDLKRAGISKRLPGGKLDFHALRLVYINLVIENGATVKEAQSLARHATPELTMNVYGRTREDRLADIAEGVGSVIYGKTGHYTDTRQATGTEVVVGKGVRWCREGDLNPHWVLSQLGPQPSASANSAIPAG